MLAQLDDMIQGKLTLLITVARQDKENLRLTFTPRTPKSDTDEDDDDSPTAQILNRPLEFTGPAQELDDRMPSLLREWSQKRIDTAAQLEDLSKQFDEAVALKKKEVEDERKKSKKGAEVVKKEETPFDRVRKLQEAKDAKPAAAASTL
jgi:PRTRC genetic system protein E